MYHWTIHRKVEFPKFPSDVRSGGSIQQLQILNSEMHSKNFPILGVHSTTFHLELRNERFILISFMGFPTILSTLQPFQICIFNRKQSKLTSSNGPQPMGKKCYGKFACIIGPYMEKQNFQNFHQMSDPRGVHSTTLDPELRNAFKKFSNPGKVHSTTFHLELRNERFILISFMGFLQY